VGIVPVYKNADGTFLFCLVHHVAGHWAFPKGHPNEGETDSETAVRELREETGVAHVRVADDDRFTESYSFEKNDILWNKSVDYFIGYTDTTSATVPEEFKNEVSELSWLSYDDALQLLTHAGGKRILSDVYALLSLIAPTS